MCGIAGKFDFDSAAKLERAQLQSMLDPISHRGPDGHGVYLDGNVGLGHRRLSIIDLSTGAQPMANEDETIWIVFNGEIYNFQELRQRLVAKGHAFRSHSDTEVIIHLYEELGPDCVRELRGMFAFAIWDKRNRRLVLARDRVGIKPLYYHQGPRVLLFGSELKSILADPAVPREIDLAALRTHLGFNYLPGEATLLKGIRKLLPGHYLVADAKGMAISKYWDLQFSQARWSMPFEQAAEELHELIRTSVRDHMIADVPVGILLSGGMDSSAICSFAVQQTTKKVSTFTIGFEGEDVVDERFYARLAAERFGTEHHEMTFGAEDFWNFLPAYAWHMEEPVCEPPAVALYYISKLARNHVKVLLSGEGGDEAFAGYPNYPNMLRVADAGGKFGPLARSAGALAHVLGRTMGDPRLQRYGHALGRPLHAHYFSRTASPASFFNREADTFFSPEFRESTRTVAPADRIQRLLAGVHEQSLLDQMLYVDSKTWLPDDLLIKADKITMANSVELRVPLLDHVVLEFAASLPPQFKVSGKHTKRILKSAFSKSLPNEIISRKKAGFPVPYEKWLRFDLHDRVNDSLLSSQALTRGYFQKAEINRLLQANASNGSHSKEIFTLLSLELWHDRFMGTCAKS